jgi:hypothetical protein
MQFGVGKLFAYVFSDFFKPFDSKVFPKGIVSFPCFKKEILWIDITELDPLFNDKA